MANKINPITNTSGSLSDLFESTAKSINENNKTIQEYQAKHNNLVEAYNKNIKNLNLKKAVGIITILEWCIYTKKNQEDYIIEFVNIQSIINVLIKETLHDTKTSQYYNKYETDSEEENYLLL